MSSNSIYALGISNTFEDLAFQCNISNQSEISVRNLGAEQTLEL